MDALTIIVLGIMFTLITGLWLGFTYMILKALLPKEQAKKLTFPFHPPVVKQEPRDPDLAEVTEIPLKDVMDSYQRKHN